MLHEDLRRVGMRFATSSKLHEDVPRRVEVMVLIFSDGLYMSMQKF